MHKSTNIMKIHKAYNMIIKSSQKRPQEGNKKTCSQD